MGRGGGGPPGSPQAPRSPKSPPPPSPPLATAAPPTPDDEGGAAFLADDEHDLQRRGFVRRVLVASHAWLEGWYYNWTAQGEGDAAGADDGGAAAAPTPAAKKAQ